MEVTSSSQSATARRTRYGLSTVILALTVTVSCVLAIVIGSRFHKRFDVTATRQHTLSPRTLRLLGTIDGAHRIIVSADMSRMHRETQRRIVDLLDEFQEAAPELDVQWLDAGQPDAGAKYESLIGSLASQHHDELAKQRTVLEEAARSIADVVTGARRVATAILELDQELSASNQTNLPDQAALVQNLSSRLEPTIEVILEASRKSFGIEALPAVDLAHDAAAAPLDEMIRAMNAVAQFSRSLGESESASQAMQSKSIALAQEAERWRDEGARTLDRLERLSPSDPLIVARILTSGEAVLVMSDHSMLAIDFDSILPNRQLLDASGAAPTEAVFAGEQLIATALGALNNARAPIIVFVHAEKASLIDDEGGPTPVARRAFGRVFDRLRLTRANALEWPVARQPLRPDPATIDPSRERPVVWIILGAPSPAGIDPRQPGAAVERNVRVEKLGEALTTLLSDRQSVLVNIEPSDFPGLGEPDPVGAALAPYGIALDSGRPLLRQESSPSGTLTWTHHVLRELEQEHIIGQATSGLALALAWVTPMSLVDAEFDDVRHGPLARLAPNSDIWGESQWLAIRGFVERGLVRHFEPLLLASPPSVDEGRDATIAPPEGWLVSVWASRPSNAAHHEQRIVVVGASSWMNDLHMRAEMNIEGRRANRFPGNAELFESSVNWLAGLDELIAPGPEVRDIPRIRPVDAGALSMLRWAIVLVPPILVLIVGALLRVWRG